MLVYAEPLNNLAAAVHREKQLKRWPRLKKKALICGDFDRLRKLSRSHDQSIVTGQDGSANRLRVVWPQEWGLKLSANALANLAGVTNHSRPDLMQVKATRTELR
jgi:hypothetical protein